MGHVALLGGYLPLEEGLGEQTGEVLLPGGQEEGGLLFLHLDHFAEMLAGELGVVELFLEVGQNYLQQSVMEVPHCL